MKICSGNPSRAPGAHDVISLSSLLVPGRANFEPYGISPIGLSFKRPEQEAEYQAFILKVTIAYIRVSLIFWWSRAGLNGCFRPVHLRHPWIVDLCVANPIFGAGSAPAIAVLGHVS
jgi:hypothetical protein